MNLLQRFNFRNYYIKKIPHSNLLFVAINETMPKPLNVRPITTSPRKIIYDESFDYSCQKLELNNLARRRLAGCYNEHPLVRFLFKITVLNVTSTYFRRAKSKYAGEGRETN